MAHQQWRSACQSTRRQQHGMSLLLAALLLVVLLAGCQAAPADQPAPPAPSPSQSAPSPSPPTTADPKAVARSAVLTAYRAYWADVVAASHTADWQSSRLDDHASGQPVQAVRNHLLLLKQESLVDRGDMRLAPKVVSLTASTAKVEDCQDLTGFLKHDARTGALRDQPSGKRFLARATLTRSGDQWKVTQVAQAITVCGRA